MKRLVPLAVCLAVAIVAPAADPLSELVDPSAKVEKVSGGYKFTEGPAWSPAGFLAWSDIPTNRILKLDAKDKVSELITDSEGANGLIFDPRGRLYACQGGGRRVVRIEIGPDGRPGRREVLADSFGGKKLNSPNDIALDDLGGVYFTDPFYGAAQTKLEQPVMGVYYVPPGGEAKRVIGDMTRPNGIAVSPDGKTLYVAEPDRRQVFAFAIGKEGVLGKEEVLFTGDEKLDGGGPDGMTLDERGNIYASYKGITILSPRGELIGRLAVPEQPANCEIGGPDSKTLYITARTSLYRVPLKVKAMKLHGPRLEPR